MDTDLTIFLNGTLRVHQPRRGYRFSVDSVLLAGFARSIEGERVLDLGTGAGILLLLLKAHYHPGPLTGVEIQGEFADLARRNLTENGFDEEARIAYGDLRDPAVVPEASFDLIVSNPPFYHSGRVQSSPDPRKASARDDRTFTLGDLAAGAARALAPSGRLCFILPTDREGEALCALASSGLHPALLRRVRNLPDAPDHRTMVQARFTSGGPPLELPPLPIRTAPDAYSEEVRLLLRQLPPRQPRFFCDAMLGTLARYLRLLGTDAAYARGADDGWLARECLRSGRILLTRDRELARRAGGTGLSSFNPDDDRPPRQLALVRREYPDLAPTGTGRCLRCDAELLPMERDAARGRVPPYTWLTRERFHACPCCGKLTWEGSHLERFAKIVRSEGCERNERRSENHTYHEEASMPASDRERLKVLLKERSLKIGDFLLASGKRSKYYFDSKLTTLTAEGAHITARCFLDVIRTNGIQAQAIGGMTLGADPIVSAVAALSHTEGLPLDAFIVRKEEKGHGTMKWIEGPVQPGMKVIVVDDVVTTGGSTLKAIEKAQDFGLEVVAVLALLDREEGGTETLSAKFPFYPVTRRSEIFG